MGSETGQHLDQVLLSSQPASKTLAFDSYFQALVPLEQIEGQMANRGQVGCTVSFPGSALILAERHVQHPV